MRKRPEAGVNSEKVCNYPQTFQKKKMRVDLNFRSVNILEFKRSILSKKNTMKFSFMDTKMKRDLGSRCIEMIFGSTSSVLICKN